MLITEDSEFDIFVASKIGSFKHIKYHTDQSKNNKKCIENLVDIKSLQKDDGITCMEWADDEQTQIMLGRKNQQIQTYDTVQGVTTTSVADFGTSDIVGLGRCKRTQLAAVASGIVKIWSKKSETLVDTGGKLDKMRLCVDEPGVFATGLLGFINRMTSPVFRHEIQFGGEENDLKVWRIGEATSMFSAKNLAHDWLQLRRPVWVTDLDFLPTEGGRIVAVCSRHGYVRLYDTRAQRRPVCNVDFPMAATCLTHSFDKRQVLVGFGRGQLHEVDLRRARAGRGYRGCAGAVQGLATVREGVVSVSLDRQLRVHHHRTKDLIYKQYLTSKLTCVLVQTKNSTPLRCNPEVKEETTETEKQELGSGDELDQLFDGMETVVENPKKKLPSEVKPSKKMKFMPSIDGSTVDLDESEDGHVNTEGEETLKEEAIAKLLRSTEKHKRRMEKKKRERKAKSVFHNA